jgi:hypothetical protein
LPAPRPIVRDDEFRDKDGIQRNRVRVRWWEGANTTYKSAALLPEEDGAGLPDLPIPAHARIEALAAPTFFGHYWLTGTPVLQSERAVCVDYSAGNGGPLVAYRFDGEKELSLGKLASVP